VGDAGYFLASPALFYFANRAAINTASKISLQDNVLIAIGFSVVIVEASMQAALTVTLGQSCKIRSGHGHFAELLSVA
jgi:hypothetical protein